MSNYIVDGADLTSVANAIRTKGGTSAQLAFPAGFVSAIENISGGWVKALSASFNQGTTLVFTTDELDDLRDRLTVTATYEDSTSETVTDYELSGTLVAGTSTIVVTYGDKSTTFTATVTEAVDVTPAVSTFVKSASSVAVVTNTTDGTVLVYTTSNGTYRYAYAPVTFEEGYGYKLSAHCDYFAGTVRVIFGNADSQLYTGSPNKTSSGELSTQGVLSSNSAFSTNGKICLTITHSTSQAGRAVFSNIKLIKYSTATAEQALNALIGGESA